MDRFVSQPLDLPDPGASATYYRADLIFEGVDHSGPSYTARIYINNPNAAAETGRDVSAGYAGSYTIFGHGGCVGEEGHCDPTARTTDAFDRRAPHPLNPVTKSVTITSALRRVEGRTMTVTVVPLIPTGDGAQAADVLEFERIRLATYASG